MDVDDPLGEPGEKEREIGFKRDEPRNQDQSQDEGWIQYIERSVDGGSGKSKATEKAKSGATGAQRSIQNTGQSKATAMKGLIHRGLFRDLLSPRALGSQKKLPAVQEEQEEGENHTNEPISEEDSDGDWN